MTDTPAGWHPAPDRPGELRYWDGQQWTEHYAPATSRPVAQPASPTTAMQGPGEPRRSLNKKILIVLGGLFVLIAACTAIVGGSDDGTDDSAKDKASESPSVSEPTKTSDPKPTKEPEPTKEPAPASDLDVITEEIVGDSDTEDQNLTVTKTRKGVYEVGFDIDDNLSDGLIESGAIRDAFSILEEAGKADAPFKRIAIRGYYPLADQNGQEIPHDDGWILYGEFTADTIGKLNPDNIDTGDLDSLDAVSADGVVWKASVFD